MTAAGPEAVTGLPSATLTFPYLRPAFQMVSTEEHDPNCHHERVLVNCLLLGRL